MNTIITKKDPGLDRRADGQFQLLAHLLFYHSNSVRAGVQVAEIGRRPTCDLADLESCMFLDDVPIHNVANYRCT